MPGAEEHAGPLQLSNGMYSEHLGPRFRERAYDEGGFSGTDQRLMGLQEDVRRLHLEMIRQFTIQQVCSSSTCWDNWMWLPSLLDSLLHLHNPKSSLAFACRQTCACLGVGKAEFIAWLCCAGGLPGSVRDSHAAAEQFERAGQNAAEDSEAADQSDKSYPANQSERLQVQLWPLNRVKHASSINGGLPPQDLVTE